MLFCLTSFADAQICSICFAECVRWAEWGVGSERLKVVLTSHPFFLAFVETAAREEIAGQ